MRPVPVTCTEDVIGALPHVLGSRPSDDLVLAMLDHPSSAPTASTELAAVSCLPLSTGGHERGCDLSPYLRPCEQILAVAFVSTKVEASRAWSDRGADGLRASVTAAASKFATRGASVWVVCPDGWFEAGCTDPSCCPPGGRDLVSIAASPASLGFILSGSAPSTQDATTEIASGHPSASQTRRFREIQTDLTATYALMLHSGPGAATKILESVCWVLTCGRIGPQEAAQVLVADELTGGAVLERVLLDFLADGTGTTLAGVKAMMDPEIYQTTRLRLVAPVRHGWQPLPTPDRECVEDLRRTLWLLSAYAHGAARGRLLCHQATLAWWVGHVVRASRLVDEASLTMDASDPLLRNATLLTSGLLDPSWTQGEGSSRGLGG